MQWLIDIIKKWVIAQGYATKAWVLAKVYATEAWVLAKKYLTTSYVDRGDPAGFDFILFRYIVDNLWHEQDLSSIVPAGAIAVLIKLQIKSTQIPARIYYRKNGNVNPYNISFLAVQVTGVWNGGDLIIALDAERKVEYLITPGAWTSINGTVSAWWL